MACDSPAWAHGLISVYDGVIEGDVRNDAGTKPVPGGVQVGSPETPFKINNIHSMHVVEVLVYTHLLV